MLVWQCPSPLSRVRAAGVHRDDAFEDGCAVCSLLQMCECVILKKNNNLAIPRLPPSPMRGPSVPLIFKAPLRWMRCPAGVMAANWVMDGVNEAVGW